MKNSADLIDENLKLIQRIEKLEQEREGIRNFSKDDFIQNHMLLDKIFNNSFSIMFIVNKDTEVVKMNDTGLKFVDKSPDFVKGKRGGNIFSCVTVAVNNKICGSVKGCKKCKLRNTVQDTISNGVPHNKVEVAFKSYVDEKDKEMYFNLSTMIVQDKPELLVLVILDDITAKKQVEFENSRTDDYFKLHNKNIVNRKSSVYMSSFDSYVKENKIHLNQNSELKRLEEKLLNENFYLKEEVKKHKGFEEIVTNDSKFLKILEQIGQVAETDSTIFISGETGTGKELVARAIHNISNRRDKEFVTVNCAAIPETLFESELFGCEKGAYTGADSQRIGKLELANNGTIFLDEIGEMPIGLQPKLLRAIQEREIERVGGNKKIKLNIRIVVATHRDIEHEVSLGRFRRDLFYRLNVFPVVLPPLRERLGDLSILVGHFIKKYTSNKIIKIIFSKKDLNRLIIYSWPGNIRELANVVERAVVTSKGGRVDVSSFLPKEIKSDKDSANKILTLEEMEVKYINDILKKTNGKVGGQTGAAALLGLKRTTLLSKMKKLNISSDSRS